MTCNLGDLAANASTIVTIDVTVNASTTGQLSNTASASSTEPDPNAANSAATEVVLVPSVSELGLLAMTALIAAALAWRLRRTGRRRIG